MTDILAQSIKLIQDTAVEAKRERIIQAKTPEPAHVYFTTTPDGTLERRVAEPLPVGDRLYSLDAVIQYAEAECATMVFYGGGEVTVINEHTRRNYAKFTLVESEPFGLVRTLAASPRVWSQRDFLVLLRTTFADCLPDYPGLRGILSKIKAEMAGSIDATVQHGNESLSREVSAKASGTGAIPEELTLAVPLYINPGEQTVYGIRCALMIDPASVTLKLRPLANEIEQAVQSHEESIGERLGMGLKGTQIHYGKP